MNVLEDQHVHEQARDPDKLQAGLSVSLKRPFPRMGMAVLRCLPSLVGEGSLPHRKRADVVVTCSSTSPVTLESTGAPLGRLWTGQVAGW